MWSFVMCDFSGTRVKLTYLLKRQFGMKSHLPRKGVLGKQAYFMQHHHLRDVGGRLGVTVSPTRVLQKGVRCTFSLSLCRMKQLPPMCGTPGTHPVPYENISLQSAVFVSNDCLHIWTALVKLYAATVEGASKTTEGKRVMPSSLNEHLGGEKRFRCDESTSVGIRFLNCLNLQLIWTQVLPLELFTLNIKLLGFVSFNC